MARGVNKVILVGNLGRDPELNYLPSGQSVAKFSLATSRSYKDKNGEQHDETEWHNIVAWGKTAEICAQYLSKGRQAYVDGRIQSRKWEDREGIKRTSFEIIADNVVLLGSRGEGGGGGGESHSRSTPGSSFDQGSSPEPGFDQSGSASPTEITDDDIPF